MYPERSQVNCQIKTQAYYYFKFMWKVQPGLLLFVALSLNAMVSACRRHYQKFEMQTFVVNDTLNFSTRLVVASRDSAGRYANESAKINRSPVLKYAERAER
jgi:hypothetical protein